VETLTARHALDLIRTGRGPDGGAGARGVSGGVAAHQGPRTARLGKEGRHQGFTVEPIERLGSPRPQERFARHGECPTSRSSGAFEPGVPAGVYASSDVGSARSKKACTPNLLTGRRPRAANASGRR